MEYFPNGDLQRYMNLPMPEIEVQQIILQVLEGLHSMHSHSFAHRDLKPAVSGPMSYLSSESNVL